MRSVELDLEDTRTWLIVSDLTRFELRNESLERLKAIRNVHCRMNEEHLSSIERGDGCRTCTMFNHRIMQLEEENRDE